MLTKRHSWLVLEDSQVLFFQGLSPSAWLLLLFSGLSSLTSILRWSHPLSKIANKDHRRDLVGYRRQPFKIQHQLPALISWSCPWSLAGPVWTSSQRGGSSQYSFRFSEPMSQKKCYIFFLQDFHTDQELKPRKCPPHKPQVLSRTTELCNPAYQQPSILNPLQQPEKRSRPSQLVLVLQSLIMGLQSFLLPTFLISWTTLPWLLPRSKGRRLNPGL